MVLREEGTENENGGGGGGVEDFVIEEGVYFEGWVMTWWYDSME